MELSSEKLVTDLQLLANVELLPPQEELLRLLVVVSRNFLLGLVKAVRAPRNYMKMNVNL